VHIGEIEISIGVYLFKQNVRKVWCLWIRKII